MGGFYTSNASAFMERLFELIFCKFALQKCVWTLERLLESLFSITQESKLDMGNGSELLPKKALIRQ